MLHLGLPDGLRDMLTGQIERLTREEQRLLEVASVGGIAQLSPTPSAGPDLPPAWSAATHWYDSATAHRLPMLLSTRPGLTPWPAPENLLAQETSPYLLQHADNPVHWRPWGKAALDEAKAANKPIMVSIGYAACHWCHVMAHESFEDPDTAALMNSLFVNIKIDREERPDIDQIYMSALACPGRAGRLAADHVHHPGWQAVLGRHLFPARSRAGAGRPSARCCKASPTPSTPAPMR